NAIARKKIIPAGQTVMADHEPSEFFANIVSGVIKLTKMMSDGRQQIVGLLFAPDFVGRAYAEKNPYFAEAASDVELCSFPREDFEKILTSHPGLEHRLFEKTLDELDSCRDWMLLLGRKSAEEKVSSFLLMIAERAPNIGCSHADEANFAQFDLPLTRADIADYLGLTIETVSRQITRLKTRGIISIKGNREIAVPDLDLLRQVAYQDQL
ncbi:MAG: Crp/Fnr family transcriptional regulator, partial [Desulfobulbia bacterium]